MAVKITGVRMQEIAASYIRGSKPPEQPYDKDFIGQTICWIRLKGCSIQNSMLVCLSEKLNRFHSEENYPETKKVAKPQGRLTRNLSLNSYNWSILFISCPPYQFMETLI